MAKKASKKPKNRGGRKAAKKTSRKPAKKAAPKKASQKTKTAAPKAPAKRSKNPLLNTILARLDEDQALNTIQIDLQNKSTIADYMVVTSGRSNRHVNAIADHVIESLHKSGSPRVRVEGMRQAEWVLIDAGDVIVHVFKPETRAFYNLEKMWARAPAQA
jgi:ribosome-associated protein